MAKIEMDLSEYQEIQKVNSLLEKSLEKERELAIQIDLLKNEKMKILKDAEKTVTIVERIDHYDTIKTLLPTEKIMENLWHFFNSDGRHMSYQPYDEFGNHLSSRLAEAFFKVERLDMYSQDKSITRKGFKEVEAEIREEIRNDVNEERQRRFDSMEAELKKLRKENSERFSLREVNEKLLLDIKREKDKRLIAETKLEKRDKFFRLVHNEVLLVSPNVFNSTKILKGIKKLITELK